jgi:uncharacterized protein YqgV (UPF0045/DUF77 family)
MYFGAQISLYPMSGDFVRIITDALAALDPYRDQLKIETDDISTLLVGEPEVLFAAMRDLYSAAARSGEHCVLSATISRGCPGATEDVACSSGLFDGPLAPMAERHAAAMAAMAGAPQMGVDAAAQFALYVLGSGEHMDEIMGCIDFVKASGVFDRPKNLCTRLRGDAGPVFMALEQAFCRFGPPQGHVAVDLTVSANSPTKLS